MLGTADRGGCVNITIISDDKVERVEIFMVGADLGNDSISTTVKIIDSSKCNCN